VSQSAIICHEILSTALSQHADKQNALQYHYRS